ncbi:MAG: hypothetical protein L6435_01645, partial [Anaerolineae bacterium]|nr:hypothetical protein [Anaerolineae bacterium]
MAWNALSYIYGILHYNSQGDSQGDSVFKIDRPQAVMKTEDRGHEGEYLYHGQEVERTMLGKNGKYLVMGLLDPHSLAYAIGRAIQAQGGQVIYSI